MEHDTTEQLNIVRDHIPHTLTPCHLNGSTHQSLTRTFDGGKCFNKKIVDGLAIFDPLFELVCIGSQLIIAERFIGFKLFINLRDSRP